MTLRRKTAAAIWAAVLVLCAGTLAQAAEWEQYLADEFTSAETMFYTGPAGSAFYAIDDNGQYVIDGLNSNVDSLSALTDNLYYYYAEARCEVVDSTAGELAFAGLVFHYNKRVKPGEYSYYVFYIYADGYYGAKRVVGDKVEIVLPLTRSDMIDTNLPNVLAVDAQGTRFDLYVNGRYVDGFTDVRIDGGGFGFYISRNTKAVFDDFVVKVERRETGQQATPEIPGANSAEPGFSGYVMPEIPRDPNRPVYPWEVGVDKSGKPPKDPEPEADDPAGGEEPGKEPADDPEPEPESESGGENAGPSVPPGEELVEAGGQPAADDTAGQPPVREPVKAVTASDEGAGDSSAVILVPASELIQQDAGDVDVSPVKQPEEPEAGVEEFEEPDNGSDENGIELPPIEEILGNLKDPDDNSGEEEAYTPPKEQGDLSLFPEELTDNGTAGSSGEPEADDGGLIATQPSAVASPGGEPAPESPGVTYITDDFTERDWPESQDDVSSYSYFGEAYQIDNLQAQTMAISFKKGEFSDAGVAVDAEFLDGRGNVGFGIAGRFRVDGGNVSYYGLFIAGSGEYLLLKVTGGQEAVLKDWTEASLINTNGPNNIRLEMVGSTITAYINGVEVTTVKDSDIRSGGYALLAGPGLAARYDNFELRGVEAE